VGGAGEARKQAARAAYEELCASVARHCLALNQQYAMRTRSYPVEVDGKISTWVDWTADQIRGDYSFELYVGSTEIKSKASVAEEIGFLLQSLAPFAAPDPQTGERMVNVRPLLRQLLSAIPEIKDVGSIVPAEEPQDPMAGMEDPEMMGMGMGMEGEPDPLDDLAALGAGGMGQAPMGLDEMPALPPGGMEGYG
ncbi:MAG: hypothetical protein H0X07_00210, partial [Gemmatimonadales bacterium]|nr:hypothetical protein [Gemmatimonadales bacterium]